MWLIQFSETIITAAAKTSDEADDSSSTDLFQSALNSIIDGDAKGRFERPTSSDSMMEVILDIATGFFVKKFVNVPSYYRAKDRKGPLEIFREAIRDVVSGSVCL